MFSNSNPGTSPRGGFRNLILASAAFMLMFAMAGCEDKGPAERAGERIDEAADDVGDRLRDAGDRMEDAGEDIRDGFDDACDKVTGKNC